MVYRAIECVNTKKRLLCYYSDIAHTVTLAITMVPLLRLMLLILFRILIELSLLWSMTITISPIYIYITAAFVFATSVL